MRKENAVTSFVYFREGSDDFSVLFWIADSIMSTGVILSRDELEDLIASINKAKEKADCFREGE